MAALLDEEYNGSSLCDYRLIGDISKHKTYKCSNLNCVNTAEFSKMLECDISHHDKSRNLYCLECVQLYQQQDLCPINKHKNPTFQDATQVINFLQFPELNVICPNSLEYKQRKLNNDLQDEDVKENEGDGGGQILATNYNENAGFVQQGCQWIGIYKNLLPHIHDECKYKPIKCEYIGCHDDDNLLVHSYNKHKKQFVAKHLDIIYQEIKSFKNANQAPLESANKMDDIMNNIKDKVDENKINIAKNRKIKVESNGILSIGVLTAIFVLIISYLLYGKYTTERCNERDIDHVSEEIIHHILSELNQSSKAHEVNGSLLQSELMEMRKIIDTDIKLKDERINELEKSIQILSKQVAGLKSEYNNYAIPPNSEPPKIETLQNEKTDDSEFDKEQYVWNWIKWIFYYAIKIIIFCTLWLPTMILADLGYGKRDKGQLIFWSAIFLIYHLVFLGYYHSYKYRRAYSLSMIIQYPVIAFAGYKYGQDTNYKGVRELEQILWVIAIFNFCLWAYFYQDGPFYFIYMLCYGYWFNE